MRDIHRSLSQPYALAHTILMIRPMSGRFRRHSIVQTTCSCAENCFFFSFFQNSHLWNSHVQFIDGFSFFVFSSDCFDGKGNSSCTISRHIPPEKIIFGRLTLVLLREARTVSATMTTAKTSKTIFYIDRHTTLHRQNWFFARRFTVSMARRMKWENQITEITNALDSWVVGTTFTHTQHTLAALCLCSSHTYTHPKLRRSFRLRFSKNNKCFVCARENKSSGCDAKTKNRLLSWPRLAWTKWRWTEHR